MPDNPLVSVIVPSYNQGQFIRRTLESILSQDYRPLEIIVVDGASTDGTRDVLRSFDGHQELAWVSERDSGVVEAVNKGFARARGVIGAIQSSDDFYLPGAIAAGVTALVDDPGLGFVFGDIAKVDPEGRELSRTDLRPYSLEAALALETWIPQPSTFFRLDLARSLGGWRTEVPYAADTDLWLRMAFHCGGRKLDLLMAQRTMHAAQRDKQGDRIVCDFTRMIDTLPGLAAAPVRVRRAAAAGRLMIRNRYQQDTGYWEAWWRVWRAIMLYPPLLRRTDVASLVPGWYLLRSQATSIKRRLTLRRGAA